MNCNLIGDIPDSITDLKNISIINLEGNKLIGYIPNNLSNLKYLKKINLSNNQLIGNIPNIKNLKVKNNLLNAENQGYLKLVKKIFLNNNLFKDIEIDYNNLNDKIISTLSNKYILKKINNSIVLTGFKLNDGQIISINPYNNIIVVYSEKSNIKSNSEDIYWDYSSLVINGNINLDNEVLNKNSPKEIIIKDSKGNIVASSNTVAVNWYSTDKNNYSGYQGIFTKEQLSKLNPNEIYKVYIEIDGKEIPIINNIKLSNKEYTINNENGDLTIERNIEKPLNVGTYETGYFTNFGYILNGNINLDNDIFSKANSRELVIKDASGNIVDKVNCASMNWYSENKDNYSGFQGIITNSVLSKLKAGEEYTFEIEVNYKGKVYNLPIENTENFILNTSMDYNIGVNAENNIVISKNNTQGSSTDSIQGVFKDGYWQPYGYVMNLEVNTGKDIPKGTKMELISKNKEGKILSITPGVDVNWYSDNKSNYNGFQAIVTSNQLINETGTNKLYVRVILDKKVYEAPVSGNINVAMSNLNYGFKTINNQIYLVKN